MGITERRQRQKEEVRNGILQAARNMVQEEGWQALSIRKIADAIEYSVPVIYDHFENKDAIMEEFVREGFGMLYKKIEEAKALHAEPAGQLQAMAQAYWSFAMDNKEYYQLMFGLGMPACETIKAIPELVNFSSLIINTINDAIGDSKVEADSYLKYRTFWSMLHGLISINMTKNVSKVDEHNGIEMDRRILEDAISGFIKALRE